MPSKPKYIQDIEKKIEDLEACARDLKSMDDKIEKSHGHYREMRDNYDSQAEVNAQVLLKLNTIMDCLKGGELNSDNGGLVKKVSLLKKDIELRKNRQARREGILVTLTVIITAAVSSLIGWVFNK
jgi:hypothetical protein